MGDTKIQVCKNGPLRIEGTDIEIVDAEGRRFELSGRTVVSLCRCGHSQNKPFCDASHGRVGFESDCPARALPPPVVKQG
jgi:CDGSH-type Zn-finger protein